MNNKSIITADQSSQATFQDNILQLIDVFVEICFDDINSAQRISQFKILALQLGYSQKEIQKVVIIGRSEYSKLLDEINTSNA
jgi:hypothetical protein